ncbi:hypothetical protein IJT10_02745 [bacterium]|nr:hypothetical protein [bacterium]
MSNNKSGNLSGERAKSSQMRARRGVSLRQRGRYGADTSGERINVIGGRRVKSFRLSGRRYGDMPGIRRSEVKSEKKHRYLVFWKPYGVDVKFTGHREDSELDYYIESPDVLPVNFLDKEAEGLMILTDDPRFRVMLTHPLCSEKRVFLALVERNPQNKDEVAEDLEDIVEDLHSGVVLTEKGARSSVELEVIPAPKLPSRAVPVRERKNVPTWWSEFRCFSGASRSVRKVMAEKGFPVLRLVLWGFGPISLVGMVPGMCREFRYEEMRWVESKLEKLEEPANRQRLVSTAESNKRSKTESKRRPKQHLTRGGVHFACRPDGKVEIRRTKHSGSRFVREQGRRDTDSLTRGRTRQKRSR